MASFGGLDQAVHVDAEGLLLKGTGEGPGGEVLEPGEQGEVHLVTAVTAQNIHPQEHLALCDLLPCGFTLESKIGHLRRKLGTYKTVMSRKRKYESRIPRHFNCETRHYILTLHTTENRKSEP